MIAGIIAVCSAWFGSAAVMLVAIGVMTAWQYCTAAGKAKRKAKRKAEREWSRK